MYVILGALVEWKIVGNSDVFRTLKTRFHTEDSLKLVAK